MNKIEKHNQQFGYYFTKGALISLGLHMFLVGIILFVIFLIMQICGVGMDDSDKSKWECSHLIVRTDYKTGVQYLETASGGITPRIDANGKIISTGTTNMSENGNVMIMKPIWVTNHADGVNVSYVISCKSIE